MTNRLAWILTFLGWLTFVASAVFFILAALKAGDPVALVASILFLLACILFMIPAWYRRPRR